MKPSESLRQHVDEVRDVIARYPVRNPQIFGSVARGEDTGKSDIDILVEPDGHASLYDLARLELELESILGCKVDVLTPASLAPDVAARARADLTPFP
jgi:predicted nucleotidyltransferase